MAFKILAEDIDTFNFIKEALDNLHPNISKQIKIAAKNGRLIECDFINEEQDSSSIGIYVPKEVKNVGLCEGKVYIETEEFYFSFRLNFEQNFHLTFI